MRRRLDLAAGLVRRPLVMFLDEPTTGLDPRSRQTMWEVIRGVVADGTSLLLTTQYLEEADQLADRVVLLDGGRVVAEGTPAALKQRVGQAGVELDLAVAQDADAVAGALTAAVLTCLRTGSGGGLRVPTGPPVSTLAPPTAAGPTAPAPPHRWRHLPRDAATMTGRALRLVRRDPEELLVSLLLPIMIMVLFVHVFGGAVQVGTDYVTYATPG